MNNTTTKNGNSKSSSSLMKHTKAQLIEIIFRKDEVEKQLREIIEQHKKEIISLRDINSKLNNELNNKTQEACNWKHEFENACDEASTVSCELKTKIKYWKHTCVVVGSIMFALIYYIFGYCI